jgi:hypothetical protein
MVGGATTAFISRRLRAAQPRTLGEHGIDPGSIPIGRSFAIGHHHSIFRLVSVSSTTRDIFAFPSWYQKISIRGNTRNNWLYYWRSAQSKRAYIPLNRKFSSLQN